MSPSPWINREQARARALRAQERRELARRNESAAEAVVPPDGASAAVPEEILRGHLHWLREAQTYALERRNTRAAMHIEEAIRQLNRDADPAT